MKQKRYRVVLLDGGDLASPGASSPAATRRRQLGLLARWWRWSWQLRVASVCVLLGILILLVR